MDLRTPTRRRAGATGVCVYPCARVSRVVHRAWVGVRDVEGGGDAGSPPAPSSCTPGPWSRQAPGGAFHLQLTGPSPGF